MKISMKIGKYKKYTFFSINFPPKTYLYRFKLQKKKKIKDYIFLYPYLHKTTLVPLYDFKTIYYTSLCLVYYLVVFLQNKLFFFYIFYSFNTDLGYCLKYSNILNISDTYKINYSRLALAIILNSRRTKFRYINNKCTLMSNLLIF